MCGCATRTTSNDNLCLIDILICSVCFCLLILFFPTIKETNLNWVRWGGMETVFVWVTILSKSYCHAVMLLCMNITV